MINKILYTSVFAISLINSNLYAKDCPVNSGTYGNGLGFQDIACKIMIGSDRNSSTSYRNFLFNDAGLIQIFSNFPGTTNSNSTGARIYYLFPIKGKKEITSHDSNHLSITHPSGVQFNFDKSGRASSPDLKMKISSQVNSNNKSGVEIESYSKGIVVDIGYRMGNTPTLNKNATVTITDKGGRKCNFPNSEFHRINGDKAELIYKTNESLHKFLNKKCPALDISDLLSPVEKNLKTITKPSSLGTAPGKEMPPESNDSKREAKSTREKFDDLVRALEKERQAKEK